ncbi:hypothetical protein Pan216_46100 [Planctomycetes bacterium Pan216]|uniref:Uncharacterized protein n=1 Tax=Kolteria novifilia TaxID=2527975 RepID=A0A518B9T7_9BACT|nr:hypothetical protein Pan216_46100 [Planctomycetes bacterium Pan216]
MDDRRPVELVARDGERIQAEFHLWEATHEDPEEVRLDLVFGQRQIRSIGRTFYGAMVAIRQELERDGLRLNCFGASKTVYPVGESLKRNYGRTAYKLSFRQPPRVANRVSIFETDRTVQPASVEEQKAFYEEWEKSLRQF